MYHDSYLDPFWDFFFSTKFRTFEPSEEFVLVFSVDITLRHDREGRTKLVLYQRLHDNFHELSFGMIRENSSKLRTYALFKTEPGIEKYLIDIKNITMRQEVKFRLSNHRLAIETGRHDGLEPHKRFSPFA